VKKAILITTIFLLSFVLILATLWFLGKDDKSEPVRDSGQNLTRENGSTEPGEVAVAVTLMTEGNSGDFESNGLNLNSQYVFYVEMNTHSVDITGFKMEEISFLTLGPKTLKASRFEVATEGGSHHRSGYLFFPKTGNVKNLKLVIKRIADIAVRDFKWNL